MAEWDDSKKFWTETGRTVFLTAVGATLAFLVLKPCQEKGEYKAELATTRLSLAVDVVDDFLAAGYRYTSVAYDVCTNLSPEGGDLSEPLLFKREKAREALSKAEADEHASPAFIQALKSAIEADNQERRSQRAFFNGEAYDDYRSAQNRLVVYFPTSTIVEKRIETGRDAVRRLRDACGRRRPKAEWEPIRSEINESNNAVASAALRALGF